MENIIKNSNAFFLCHGGLGDIFIMSSAIRLLSYYYNKVFVFCPNNTIENIKLIFGDLNNIEFILYGRWYERYNNNNDWPAVTNDWKHCLIHSIFSPNVIYENFDWVKYKDSYSDINFLGSKDQTWDHWVNFGKQEGRFSNQMINVKEDDIFIMGHIFEEVFSYYKNDNIQLKYYLSTIKNKDYKKPYYYFIESFYNHNYIPLSVYYDFFKIPSTDKSIQLYNNIKNYKIVFLHFMSSKGQSLLPDNEWLHIYNEEYLIINPDKNHYNENENNIKFNLANQYLNLLVVDYIDIINNATDIYVCDSCFANMIFPLRINNILKAKNVIIYDRYYPNFHCLTQPVNLSN